MQFSKYSFTSFTVTIASPGVFSATAHELSEGDQIILESTGALPTGLTIDTVVYYVIRNGLTANTFQVSISDPKGFTTTETRTAVVTTGSQSGAHTFLKVNRARFTTKQENSR